MGQELTAEQRKERRTAVGTTRRVREWRRYRAVLLADEGHAAPAIAATLQVSEASVYNWLAAWRNEGLAGLHEGVHPGLAPRLDAAGLVWLDGLLRRDPQECGYTLTGWTVPALGRQDPGVPKLLIWDNAPPHHPTRVLTAAAAVGVEIAWLPFRAPELNPCEDLWRVLKSTIAGNRVFADVADLAAAASRWLAALTTAQVRRSAALTSHKFQWLPT